MNKSYILAVDQGTTSSRAILFDKQQQVVAICQQEFTQHFPKPGWVEHDALEILDTQLKVINEAIAKASVSVAEIAAIGITNQRETTVVWDKTTGKPVYNAIVWQDKRTTDICEDLKDQELTEYVKDTTGLVIDSYFSGTKVKWILDNAPEARQMADDGKLLFGTIDTWLTWNFTKGAVHASDYSNASRTMLYDINKLDWDDEMLRQLNIPKSMLPEIRNSSGDFGNLSIQGVDIPICGVAGDQQAALFGQRCFEVGMAKNTYGTGCFMLMNTGDQKVNSKHGLLTTIGWGIDGEITYALEGSVFVAGAAIQWLRDGLNIVEHSSDTEELANQAESDEVYVVPAFAGLGAPYWDMYARGAVFGLTRDAGKAELSKATLQSLAYQTRDILEAMSKDSGTQLKQLQVDGGATANNYLMQFQADILSTSVHRPIVMESTALGAALLAGLHVGVWSKEELSNNTKGGMDFEPEMDALYREKLYAGWKKAVSRTMGWLND